MPKQNPKKVAAALAVALIAAICGVLAVPQTYAAQESKPLPGPIVDPAPDPRLAQCAAINSTAPPYGWSLHVVDTNATIVGNEIRMKLGKAYYITVNITVPDIYSLNYVAEAYAQMWAIGITPADKAWMYAGEYIIDPSYISVWQYPASWQLVKYAQFRFTMFPVSEDLPHFKATVRFYIRPMQNTTAICIVTLRTEEDNKIVPVQAHLYRVRLYIERPPAESAS